MLSWGTRRKLLYFTVAGLLAAVALITVYVKFFTAPPLCTDGIQNGTEEGIDCGGYCALVCQSAARQPLVLWARSFPVSQSNYTAAAYIQNQNPGAGSHQIQYSFRLFDAENNLITEREGVADLPPVQTLPIIEPNIAVGNRVVARTLFTFMQQPVWYKVAADTLPPLSISQEELVSSGANLSAVITNNGLTEVKNISIAAVLFNASSTAIAASKTIIPSLPAKTQQPITFTWPQPNIGVAHAEITVLPSF